MAWGIWAVETGGHNLAPDPAKGRRSSYPMVGISGDARSIGTRAVPMRAFSAEKQLVLTDGSDEKLSGDWKSYWGIDRTPFVEHDPPYVSLPAHDEAARLLSECVRSGGRGAELVAEAGLGKTTLLRRVFAEVRSPRRRCILMSCPREADLLPGLLAERLGERLGREPGRLACWRAVERALRLMSILGTHIVIGFDDCQNATPTVRRDIAVLTGLGTGCRATTDDHPGREAARDAVRE